MADNSSRYEFFRTKGMVYTQDATKYLFNRETVLEYVRFLVEKKLPFSLAICIADDYDLVNKSFGSNATDDLISIASKCIIDAIGDAGIAGRYDDDKFIVVLDGISEYNDVWMIFHQMNTKLLAAKIPGNETPVSLTSGISRYPLDGKTSEELLLTTSKALTRGKEKGKACFIIYLAAKHQNIVANVTEKKKNPYKLLFGLFEEVNKPGTFKEISERIVHMLGTEFSMNHIIITNGNEVVAEYISSDSKTRTFHPIPDKCFDKLFDENGLFYLNSMRSLFKADWTELYQSYANDDISSSLGAKIQVNGKCYGILRADMVGNFHSWSEGEQELYLLVAKLIATVLSCKS